MQIHLLILMEGQLEEWLYLFIFCKILVYVHFLKSVVRDATAVGLAMCLARGLGSRCILQQNVCLSPLQSGPGYRSLEAEGLLVQLML